MSAFFATHWPILALAYAFIVLFVLGVFRLGASADDLDQLADRNGIQVPSNVVPLHSYSTTQKDAQHHA